MHTYAGDNASHQPAAPTDQQPETDVTPATTTNVNAQDAEAEHRMSGNIIDTMKHVM